MVIRHEHRGIPFNEWLDLFLEYAISLALEHRTQESYDICASAKDSIVFKDKENAFLIHLAYASALSPFPATRLSSVSCVRRGPKY